MRFPTYMTLKGVCANAITTELCLCGVVVLQNLWTALVTGVVVQNQPRTTKRILCWSYHGGFTRSVTISVQCMVC
jgi:hypothetical protein